MKQAALLSVVIERLALRGVTHTSEDTREYVFEVSAVRDTPVNVNTVHHV